MEAILLGLVQAFTEFLPVSSSGHLVLTQAWWGEHEVDALFNVLLHTATTVAVLLYFRREIAEIVVGLFGSAGKTPPFAGFEAKTVWLIVVANVPTALLGLVVKVFFEDHVSTVPFVSSMLLITGGLLWLERGRDPKRKMSEMTLTDALVIGVAQGVAVLPGLSRSGLTIVTAMMLGLDRLLAVKFSLLISIPAILGATLLEALDVNSVAGLSFGPYLSGMVVAALAGYGAVHLILVLVDRKHFFRFAFYLWPVGLFGLLSHWFGR